MRAPRITDVAKMAGVSTATVSRALNQPDSVAETTRQSVADAVAKTGYRINIAAQNLRRQRSGAVVVLVPNLGNPFFSEILSGVEATLAAKGLSVLIADTKHPSVPTGLVIEYLQSRRADGIVSLDGNLPDLVSAYPGSGHALPPIVYACEWNDAVDSPSIRVDNAKGAAMAVAHLASLGHIRLGHICGPENNILTRERRDGFVAALRSRHLDVRPDWFFAGDFSIASGRRAAGEWLRLRQRPTAVFCASDETAFGFISGLHDAAVRVPEDVSVVGFDDIEIARHYIPPLTTIRQPRAEIGAAAARKLIQMVEGEKTSENDKMEILPVRLVVRSSTAPCSQD